MAGLSRIPVFAMLGLLGWLAVACGSSDGRGVSVEWRTEDSSTVTLAPGAAPLPTVVYLRNQTRRTLRQVQLSFTPSQAGGAYAGLSIGTITRASTRFEGENHLWDLGDLPPNTQVAFKIGLWFESNFETTGDQSLELTVELSSPDLEASITSNALRIKLEAPESSRAHD